MTSANTESAKADRQALQASLSRLESVATLTDSRFRIPIIGVRFGIDAIIGLVPVVGDAIGAIISLSLFVEATRLGAPWRLRVRMLLNIGLDFLVGLIPFVGDIADVAFKANTRNIALLRQWINVQLSPPKPQSTFGAKLFAAVCVAVIVLCGVLAWQRLMLLIS